MYPISTSVRFRTCAKKKKDIWIFSIFSMANIDDVLI